MSRITIDDIELELDPDVYEPMRFPRRGSVLRTVDGGTVVQDRGVALTDTIIQLSGRIYLEDTLKDLTTLYVQTGNTFTFSDWYDNEFTVMFVPGQESLSITKPQDLKGSTIGWAYSISLIVIACTKWFGVTDGFPVNS